MIRRACFALVALAGACDPTSFDPYRSGTPVVTLPQPDDYPDLDFAFELGFSSGSAIGGDHVITSGGLGEAVASLPVREGTNLAPRTGPARIVCSAAAPCAGTPATGSALAGLGSWNGASECALTGAFGTVHRVHVACFGDATPGVFDISPPAGFETSGFGLGLAAPRRRAGEGPTADLVVVGAPEHAPDTSTDAPGAIFVATPTSVIDVTPAPSMDGAALGSVLAVGRATSGGVRDLVVVAGSPALELAYVLRGSPPARPMRIVGCVSQSGEPGFGGAVALGDFDADGDDDIAVGDDAFTLGRLPHVNVYLAAGAPTDAGCAANAWVPTRVDCAPSASSGIVCTGGSEGFGSALAAGDLDGDGRDELAVGAPIAAVDGTPGAGAVFVLSAHGSGATFGFDDAAHVARLASPVDGASVGTRVLIDQVAGRDELFATAPGAHAVVMFLCTGLAGDAPDAPGLDGQCRPTR